MKTPVIALAVIASFALAGCAKKRPPIDAAAYAPGVSAPGLETAGESQRDRLQSDLVARAGSDRILFELDSSTLTSQARQILTRQAAWLNQHPGVNFVIEGHCDERGTREYNLALGDRRARVAAEFMALQGISPARIRTISYGKERPEALSSDEAAYAQNRRAVSIAIEANGQ
ncbi:MAG: peptidoglycan-associated lipoprotein Pal [Tsuneonella sp.]